jgi:hypothetical protein
VSLGSSTTIRLQSRAAVRFVTVRRTAAAGNRPVGFLRSLGRLGIYGGGRDRSISGGPTRPMMPSVAANSIPSGIHAQIRLSFSPTTGARKRANKRYEEHPGHGLFRANFRSKGTALQYNCGFSLASTFMISRGRFLIYSQHVNPLNPRCDGLVIVSP